ncbi:uncharacterized protein BXIN_2491 [Babesia sp. Xinjiang]|uniref:uncharacterized protein n=1 Tax=Babesia sp. Xinjiang TaxID=462227 RepID=UPI000A24E4B8|nr:uncharacterized protein BXIN_2491 [Babesia sp. Xinjiang]ORM41385.1 hypothetical protein BXIN_2491 [Babesia sp. Xinjiang]
MDSTSSDMSPLVDAEVYRRWRSAEIDEIELCMWSADMFMYGISTSYESYGSLKTAIRRGVPDLIKHYIWIKANGADRFYREHPNFYKHSFATTFGQNVPETMGHDCPTFCGGISGLQSDILGAPIKAKDIDFDSASLDAESLTNSVNMWNRLGEAKNYSEDGYDTCDDEPLTRELSVASLRDHYQPRKSHRTLQQYASIDTVMTPRYGGSHGSSHRRSQLGLPDVIDESCELQRRDTLDNYLSAVHAKDHNQMELLKATKKKIRERHSSIDDYHERKGYNRQFSDTLLVTGRTPLPNPPSHHPSIIGKNVSPQLKKLDNEVFPRTTMIIKYLRDREQQMAHLTSTRRQRPFSRIIACLLNLGSRCAMSSSCRRVSSVKRPISSGKLSVVDEPHSRGVGYDIEVPTVKTSQAPSDAKDGDHHVSFAGNVDVVTFGDDDDDDTYTDGGSQMSLDEPESTDTEYIRFPSTKVDNVLVRHSTTMVFQSSVYKLSDVTDFTALLTREGVNEVKRIMWCLNTSFASKIEFLPIIPSLCCILLVYMTPESTLCVLHCLMTKAVKSGGLEYGERFLFVDREGFINFVGYVLSVMRYHLRKLVSKLQLLNVDVVAWIARSVQGGFSHILPFDYILRIYGDFLFEGEVVLCRYCIALVKHGYDRIMRCNTQEEAEKELYNIGLDPSLDLDKLTKLAYSFRLKYYKSDASGCALTPYLMPVKIKSFYRPRMASYSDILKEHTWEVIWSWLLPGHRILDPKKIYSSDTHGTTMLGMVKTIKESNLSGVSALLFIETMCGDVFGVFIPVMNSEPTKGFFTPQKMSNHLDSFVFTLVPEAQIYKCSAANNSGIKFGTQQIVVGSDMPALILDKNMASGLSQCCRSYNSPPLVSNDDGYFDVLRIELWYLV